jgi:AraC family transcriptional regulator of arabinose operon
MTFKNSEEFIDKTDYLETRLLQVNSCGSERVVKYDYTILRSKGRRDYHFLYLQSGWLDIEVGTVQARLTRGQCAVFLPNVRQKYSFTAAGDPVSLFLHFTGRAAAEAMQFLHSEENIIYTISDQVLFESLFKRLNYLQNVQQTAPMQILEENSILLQLITILCRSSVKNEVTPRSDILNAMEYMREHMQEQINFQKFAEALHLSYSRFAHLFTQSVGISPQQYLLRLRLDRARGLLRDSSMSVSEIADSTGFNDPFYFSRKFSNVFGLSPRKFRSECHKKDCTT